jgi:hypothetical protein
MTNNQKVNLDYFYKLLGKLRGMGLVGEYNLIPNKNNRGHYNIIVTRRSDDKAIVIETDLEKAYWATFEDYYQESTDYLLPKDRFETHVDWLGVFLEAYLKHDYYELLYRDKSTGNIAYKELVFDNQRLGRKQLIGCPPKHFLLNRLLRKYRIEICHS